MAATQAAQTQEIEMKLTHTLYHRMVESMPAHPTAYAWSDLQFNDNQLDRAVLNELLRFAQNDEYAQKMYRRNLNL